MLFDQCQLPAKQYFISSIKSPQLDHRKYQHIQMYKTFFKNSQEKIIQPLYDS